jgi:hypothetical protein
MGELPDYSIGERVDMLAVLTISKRPEGLAGGEKYEALFPGTVRYVWEDVIDVQAGEQVFRVPRRAIHQGDREGEPWRFKAEHVEDFHELEYYDPESEIDYDLEDDDDAT